MDQTERWWAEKVREAYREGFTNAARRGLHTLEEGHAREEADAAFDASASKQKVLWVHPDAYKNKDAGKDANTSP